jgi:aminoglycoside phosphotransferase family enzyme
VIRITRDKSGIALDGQGQVLEYAVKMQYLPQERMLNVLLENDLVSPDMIEALVLKLVDFHTRAETSPTISAFGTVPSLHMTTDENFYQTERYFGITINPERFRRIKDYTNNMYLQKSETFRQRVANGRIRDCHGDLYAQNICFTRDICIYDCIEFNDRFRYCDVASEIAFLAMDLDHYGKANLSRSFVNAYMEQSGDQQIRQLLNFYRCYRAFVRGKVNSFKYDDPYIAAPEREQTRCIAASYFELAESYTRTRPLLFITVGLVGSGKTTFARALAKRLGLTHVSSDIVRKQLAAIPATEHRFENMESGIYSTGIYSAEFTRRTYDNLFSTARAILTQGNPVILDASFIKVEERRNARQLKRAISL